MTSSDLWSTADAEHYDAEEAENSSATALAPTLDFLAELAGDDGRALEFAIGTGRVGVPLQRRGVPVVGIELSEPMVDVLRRKADADALPSPSATWPPPASPASSPSSISSTTRSETCSPRTSRSSASATRRTT